MKRDWEILGEEIKESVQSAIDNQDFRRLNQTISDNVSSAMEQLKKGYSRTYTYTQTHVDANGKKVTKTYVYEPKSQQKPVQKPKPAPVAPKPVLFASTGGAKAGAIVMTSIGSVFAGVMLAGLGIGLGGAAVVGLGVAKGLLMTVPFGIFAIAGGALAAGGVSLLGRVHRFQEYVKRIGKREYCDIKELADQVKKSKEYVAKDLRKMINSGWFKQGHLDNQKTCLMVSNNAYMQYTTMLKNAELKKQEQERIEAEEGKINPEVRGILRSGKEYLRQMHECNDHIPGEEISAKIARIEMLSQKIFDRVKEHPENATDIRKMMEYYLPTTVKLLQAYEEMDHQPVQGETIIASKKEIENTLDTLNVAFENLLDSLFEDVAWDVSTDISVLNTMLAQEGLMEKDFK